MLHSALRQSLRRGYVRAASQARSAAELKQLHPAFVRENTWESWDQSSRQRTEINLSADVTIEEAKRLGTSEYAVKFSDGHKGHFRLPEHSDDVWERDLRSTPQQYWGSDFPAQRIEELVSPGGPLRFNFDYLHSGEGQCEWAAAMHKYGIAIVEGMPVKEDTVVEFAKMAVGYVYPTVYGDKFTIKAVADPNNLAFSSLGLQQHTDLPYYHSPPSIQLFHCITKAEQGGESLFLDGLDAALDLKKQDREAFDTLCKVKVRFQDLTSGWHLSAKHATFVLNDDETIERVCFNERSRDSWREWKGQTTEEQAKFYDALRKYERLVEDRERYVRVVLEPGEMACTDNWRVMHSRAGFAGSRHLEGAYVDWDALYARWRVTKPSSGLSMPQFYPLRPAHII